MTNEEAIELLKTMKNERHSSVVALMKAIEALNNERPHGKWIYHENWENDGECPYECSKCGTCYDYDMNFCGKCGADMRGGQDNGPN